MAALAVLREGSLLRVGWSKMWRDSWSPGSIIINRKFEGGIMYQRANRD